MIEGTMTLEGALKHVFHAAYRVHGGYAYLVARSGERVAIWSIPLLEKELEMREGYPLLDLQSATYYCDTYGSNLSLHNDLSGNFGVNIRGGWLPYNHNPLA